MSKLEIYWSFRSPYSYLAIDRLAEIADGYDVETAFRFGVERFDVSRDIGGVLQVIAASATRTTARVRCQSTGRPSASRSMVHSRAGLSRPGSRLVRSSLRIGG